MMKQIKPLSKLSYLNSPMYKLFTYGSLMCSDIMFKVAGCQSNCISASLKNFQRSSIHGEKYPGIFQQADATVEGILYLDLSQDAIERLDEFEGEQYHRQEVQVLTQQFGACMAMTYIIKPHYHNILTGKPWDFNHFLANGKTEFLKNYSGFQKI